MLEPGAVVGGDYRVERKLSEGGMGAVFVAEQISTGAKRALKIIKAELLHEPKLRARFEQEAKVAAKIESDHIVSVVAAGFDADLKLPWLAMELLTGETLLGAVTSRGSLPRPMTLAVLLPALAPSIAAQTPATPGSLTPPAAQKPNAPAPRWPPPRSPVELVTLVRAIAASAAQPRKRSRRH